MDYKCIGVTNQYLSDVEEAYYPICTGIHENIPRDHAGMNEVLKMVIVIVIIVLM